MSISLALAPLLAATAAASAATPCTPIAGWEQVLSDDAVRWIVIGEMHGNNESPAIFADAVCLTAAARPRVVVGVEHPASEQAAIDRFLASDGGEAARAEFLRAPMWNPPRGDGRTSAAMLRLFETLRQYRQAGRIEAVLAFIPGPSRDQAQHEENMAASLRAAAGPDITVIALAGNVHAMRAQVPWPPRYMPMASLLPHEATYTVNASGHGGESWTCQEGDCKPHALPARGAPRPRSLEPIIDPEAPYAAMLHVGGALTASPPQPASPAGP